MQKVESIKNTQNFEKTKNTEKLVEKFIGAGVRHNGCWTSGAAGASDIAVADAANQKLNPNAQKCKCDEGTQWMLVSDSTQSQQIYGCEAPLVLPE